jgi:hypothetical protein
MAMPNPAPSSDFNFALFIARFVEQFKQGRLDEAGALQGLLPPAVSTF